MYGIATGAENCVPGSVLEKTRSQILLFFGICVEIGLAAALFYFIVFVERLVGGFSARGEDTDLVLYWFGYSMKLLLLSADGVVMIFFVSRGVREAWMDTRGETEEQVMGFLRDIVVVAHTAFKDTAQNILRPVHNLRVVLGREHEEGLSEKIDMALASSRSASNQQIASSTSH